MSTHPDPALIDDLVLANHIGDLDVLKQAIQLARDHLDE